jgi:hypothetical protein
VPGPGGTPKLADAVSLAVACVVRPPVPLGLPLLLGATVGLIVSVRLGFTLIGSV